MADNQNFKQRLLLTTFLPPQYAVVIIHGILIGLLSLLALPSTCTAILAANALTECIAKMEGVPWNGDFIGDDIWLAVLVFGSDCSARPTNDQ
ncbi:hypothetical protein niasHT_018892 [Heterodera trifolii]|uniref:Uncharacterized protein n=1 Tax=Heterodera trifolii TaxID=157864 RepID=A0ABD2LEF8_9BILA